MKAEFLPARSGRTGRNFAGYTVTGVVTTLGAIAGVIALSLPTTSSYVGGEATSAGPAPAESVSVPRAATATAMTGAPLSTLHASIKGEPEELPPTF